jgi:hypothetical protein
MLYRQPEWIERNLWSEISPLDHWDHAIMERTDVNEGFSPIARDLLPSYLFISLRHATRTLLLTVNLIPQTS